MLSQWIHKALRGNHLAPKPLSNRGRKRAILRVAELEPRVTPAVITPFTPVFTANTTGDISIIGNTLMTVPDSDRNAQAVRDGVGRKLNNNDHQMVYVDIDSDPSTFNSSSATLNMPAGATVLFAGLYWGADSNNAARTQVKFMTPGSAGYQDLTGTLVGVLSSRSSGDDYHIFRDVTSLVQAAGNGTYSVANVQARTGGDHHAGWSLVVAYRDPNAKPRNLTVFNGYAEVANNQSATIPISGFLAPQTGPVDFKFGVVSYEGDRDFSGDYLEVNGQRLSTSTNPRNNFFNSSISDQGVAVSAKAPNYNNQLGFDITTVERTGLVANNATSATISLKTSQDRYYPGVVISAIDLYAPVIDAPKTALDVNGGLVESGDIVEYTLRINNKDGEDAVDMVLTDPIPANTTYVPGSFQILSGPNQGAKTDAPGDDQFEYDAGGNRIVVRLGTGADATNGGRLDVFTSTIIRFRVQVNAGTPDSTRIQNQANIDFKGATTGIGIVKSSVPAVVVVRPEVDPTITITASNQTPNVGDQITLTVTATNNGPYDATGIIGSVPLAPGLQYVSHTGGGYNSATGEWTIGNLPLGQSPTLQIVVKVVSPNAIVQPAVITPGLEPDTDLGNNNDSVTITPLQADIELTKSVDNPTPNVGDIVTFTIVAKNNGPDGSTGLVVEDRLPPGLTFVSATPKTGVSQASDGNGGRIILWTTGDIANQATKTLTVRAKVTVAQALQNVVAVKSARQPDPVPLNNRATVDVTSSTDTDLQLTKVVDIANPDVGDVVHFTVTVTNAGPIDAKGVQVTDRLPAGLKFVSAAPASGTKYKASKGIWTIGNLAVGRTRQLVITAKVLTAGTKQNTGEITSFTGVTDPNPSNNIAHASVTPKQADLTITKSASTTRYSQGQEVTYTIAVSNTGTDDSAGVVVNEMLPAGLTFVSAGPPAGTSYNSTTGVWTIGTLAAGATVSMTIVASAVGTADITNSANVTSKTLDPIPGNNTSTFTLRPQTSDLLITKTVDNPAPNLNDIVTFTIGVRNAGPDVATGVEIVDVLPAGLTIEGVPTANQGTYDTNTGVWSVGIVDTTFTRQLTIQARVTSTADILNVATITKLDQLDPNPNNNQAQTPLHPLQADLSIHKTVDKPVANFGDTVTFTVEATNHGPGNASGVRISDKLPKGLVYLNHVTSTGTYNPSSGAWSIPLINNGQTAILTIQARLTASSPVTNTGRVTRTDQPDPNPNNNTGNATVTPTKADVSVAKAVDNPSPNVGDTVTFTITASNQGPDPATGIKLTDQLPAGLAFVSATASQGTYDSNTGIWDVGTITPGAATPTLVIVATMTASTATTNVVEITDHGPVPDPNPKNDRDTVKLTPKKSDLRVVKSANVTSSPQGGTVQFSVLVRNAGPDDADGVQLTDQLPAGLTLVSAAPTRGAYDSATGVWTIGNLVNGGQAELIITATFNSTLPVTNTATVTSTTLDPKPNNNTDMVTLKPQFSDLSVTKSVSNATPQLGDEITFTLVARNLGPDAATAITVGDQLPAGLTYVSHNAPNNTIFDPTSGVWTIPTLASGASRALKIVVRVDATGPKTNTAAIQTPNQIDPVPTNNQSNVTLEPLKADLRIAKTVDKPATNVGDTVTFTITLNNDGPGGATNVSVNEALPAGLTFVSSNASNGTQYDSVSGVWTIGNVPNGATRTLTIQAQVDSVGSKINEASINPFPQIDPNPLNNITRVETKTTEADLEVRKVVDIDRPDLNGVVRFTVTVRNLGPATSNGVTVNDALPAGLTFVSATPSQGSYDSATGVWTVGDIASLATVTLEIAARASGSAEIVNTATVTSKTTDPIPGNNTATSHLRVKQADLSVDKHIDNPSPNQNDTVTYTINVRNDGPDLAPGVIATENIPPGLNVTSVVASQGTFNQGNGQWSIGDLASGAVATLTIQAVVTTPSLGVNTVTVQVPPTIIDPIPTNNTATATFRPNNADIQVTKVADDTTPVVGQVVEFTVTATNNGPNDSTGVEVLELLSAGLEYVSSTPSGTTSYDSATGIWTIGNLPNQASETLIVRARVTSPLSQLNFARVNKTNQFDPNPSNNGSGTPLTPRSVDIVVVKGVSNTTPNVGDTIQFFVDVENLGPNDTTNVVVNDLLPSGLSFVGATPPPGTTYDPTSGDWSIPALAVGQQLILVIDVMVDSAATMTNIATLTQTSVTDLVPGNNQYSRTITPKQTDLQVVKSVNNPTPVVGETVTFRIELTNTGSVTADQVTLTDVLSAGLQFVAATPAPGTSYDSNTNIWTVPSVQPNQTFVLEVQATVTSADPQANTISITTSQTLDPNPGNNTSTSNLTPQRADLSVLKTVDKPRPIPGEIVTYTIRVSNAGPSDATGVTASESLPAGLSFVQALTSQGQYNLTTGIWDIGAIPNGGSAELQLRAIFTGTSAVTNTVTLTPGPQVDPNPLDNTSTVMLTPQESDVALAKSVDNPTPDVGDTVEFTITVSNNGPDTATSVSVDDKLPAGLEYVSHTAGQGTYDPTTGIWNVGVIPTNGSFDLVLRAIVRSTSTVTNLSSVRTVDQVDRVPVNNTSQSSLTPRRADLQVTKSVSDPQPTQGTNVTFTVQVTNNGPDDAGAFTILEKLPVGLSLVGIANPSVGTYDPASGVWSVPGLANGATATLTFDARVDSVAPVTNIATIPSARTLDPNPGNNTGQQTITPLLPTITVDKTVDNPRARIGDTVVFTVTATNAGPGIATGLQLIDQFPTNMQFVSAVPSVGTYDTATGTWDVGTLAANAFVTLTLTGIVNSPAPATNVVGINRITQLIPNPNTIGDSVTVTPPRADLQVRKAVNVRTQIIGGLVTFTVSVTNRGPDDAGSVTLTDKLPAGLAYVSSNQAGYDPITGVWTVGTVNSGDRIKLTIVARVLTLGTKTNVATVADPGILDPNLRNNRSFISITGINPNNSKQSFLSFG